MESPQSAQATHNSVRRLSARLRLHLPGRLILIGRSCQCLVENISITGAQLMAEEVPRIGTIGQLKCEGLTAYFEVIWSAGSLIGVEFDEPVSLQEVLRLRSINDTYSELQRMEVRRTARRWVTGELG